MDAEIFSKNYVNSECNILVDSGETFIQYLYDGDKSSYWISDTNAPNDDSYPLYVDIQFVEGTAITERIIDRLMITGCNLEKFRIKYWNGAAWVSLYSDDDNASETIFYTFPAPVTTSRVIIEIDDTFPTAQRPYIGEIWFMEYQYILANIDSKEFNFEDIDMSNQYRLASGQMESWKIIGSQKFTLKANMDNVTQTLRDNLYTTWKSRRQFGFAPNRDVWDYLIQNVFWIGKWNERFVHKVNLGLTTKLYKITLDIEQL